ncbi:MAG: ATP-binding cassette domain-containing protein [Dysgonamonadaceae bacterium]|jgi:ABC-type lipoprotein export system ATPase subunit|nr:ATP-binding cassette domain-containing protein [Dysgonamonadaceae bacterium]
MDKIQVNRVLPDFISGTGNSVSEIWSKELAFHRGKNYLIRASSGKGKSSLLSYIFGERTDYTGDILLDQAKLNTLTPAQWIKVRRTKISCVFQGLRLFPDLTAIENVIVKNQLTDHKTPVEISDLFVRIGLEEKMKEKVARLSFGQQQRVAIIRALCQPFDFILMDEPFSHLDEENIAVVAGIVKEELARKDAGLLLSTLGEEYPFEYQQTFEL